MTPNATEAIDERQVFDVDDIAAAYGVKRETVWGWVRSSRIAYFRTPTGRVRFPRAALPSGGAA